MMGRGWAEGFLAYTLALSALTTAAQAQSVDVSSERVSLDRQRLAALRGEGSIGSVAVWPIPVRAALHASADPMIGAFDAWVEHYYQPFAPTADTTASMRFAESYANRFRLGWLNDGSTQLQVDAAAMVRFGQSTIGGDSAQSFLLARPSVRAMGSMFGGSLGFFLDLSNGMRLSGVPARIAGTDPTLGRTFKFMVEEQTFFDRYVGYIQYQAEHLRVRFGREQMQFGFSPIDNFVHSINAPMMDGLLIDVPYGPIRFTSTHSQAEGTDTNGVAVQGKYIATHRISVEPTDWLSVSVSDMIVYWGRGLDFTYLNPLAFFVSAGLGTDERSRHDNSMLGFDAAIRPYAGAMIYGSFIIDDLSYSTLTDTTVKGNNNKFAAQIGVSQLLDVTSTMPALLTAEYARIDPFAFAHRSVNASYTSLGAPVGYDMQSNSDRLALQAQVWITPRTSLKVDVDYTRHGENYLDSTGRIAMGEDPRYPGSGLQVAVGNVGGDILRGDMDFITGNRFLKGLVSHQRRINATFSAEWIPNVFTDVRLGYTNRNGGNTPGSFLFGYIELRVGY